MIMKSLELKPILEGNEYIFHLAAAASVPMSVENPMNTHINNVDANIPSDIRIVATR